MPEALPAVTVPSFLNTARSLARSSGFVSPRTCSSVSKIVSPLRDLQRDRQDLALEAPFLDRPRRALVRRQRQFILLTAGDLMRFGQVLGGDTHVDVLERVVQRGGHHVDHRGVAHACAPAHSGRQVAGAAHALGASGDGDVGIPKRHGLGGGDDGLQAGPAETVQGQRRRVLGDAGVYRGDAGQVHVLGLGMDDVAEHDVLDFVPGDTGAGKRLPCHLGAEFGGRKVLEAAAEVADGGADAGDNVNFALHGCILLVGVSRLVVFPGAIARWNCTMAAGTQDAYFP